MAPVLHIECSLSHVSQLYHTHLHHHRSSNIFITASGCLKLADFGLAAVLDAAAPVSRTLVRPDWASLLIRNLSMQGLASWQVFPCSDIWCVAASSAKGMHASPTHQFAHSYDLPLLTLHTLVMASTASLSQLCNQACL